MNELQTSLGELVGEFGVTFMLKDSCLPLFKLSFHLSNFCLPLRFSALTYRKRHASFEIRVWLGVSSTIELRKASFSFQEDSIVKAPVAAIVQSKDEFKMCSSRPSHLLRPSTK